MQTKILMSLSALLMAITGLAASFMPKEILTYAKAWDEGFEVFLVQILGALYLGFAMLNWTARASLIGGIYSRPVALGNFMHFVIVAVTLMKSLFAGFNSIEIMVGTAIYCIFALWFGAVLFSHPVKK
ncbi:MAG: hypothetical protein V4660_01500 [Pseudomonadota bacterium]